MEKQFVIEYYIKVGRYEKAARLITDSTVKAALLDMAEIHNKHNRQQELLRELALSVYRRTR